jgi:hypothetical protein
MQLRNPCFFITLLLWFLLPHSILCGDKNTSQEEGQFDIYVANKKIGQEKFSIVRSSDAVSSNSTTKFSNPAGKGKSVQIEAQLKMDGQYLPQTYQVHTGAGSLKCAYVPSQATFECPPNGARKKNGLVVGERYAILDTNVFHHFIFAVHLLDFRSKGKAQSVEVVVPQEMDTGILKIVDIGTEGVSVQGKNRELHHLKVDSGPVKIDLWIDEEHVLYKIALPAKQIEVIRH